MPELPEVETIVRGISQKLVGKTISDIKVFWPKTVQHQEDKLAEIIKSARIKSAQRRGKLIIINLDNDFSLLIHLKLTGQLIYQDKRGTRNVGGHPEKVLYGAPLPHKYTVVEIGFTDASRLYFNDLRKFGWLKAIKTSDLQAQKEFKELGIEPLGNDFSLAKFKQILAKRPNQKIKEFLMDQGLIAGIGNIYASEILWESKVAPTRQIKTLKSNEIDEIYKAISKILNIALKMGGSSENTYVRLDGSRGNFMNYAKVYQKQGKDCFCKDGGVIKRIKIGQRSAFYCPVCQK